MEVRKTLSSEYENLIIKLPSEEVIFLESLDENELTSNPGPFNIIRVIDFISTLVQDTMIESFFGNTACSQPCGREGEVDMRACLNCVASSYPDISLIDVVSPDQ